MRRTAAVAAAAVAATLAACTTWPERTGVTTLRGEPVTLQGRGVEVGREAPDFAAIATDGDRVRLSDFRGKTVMLASVPSLETSVCSTEARTFNERGAALSEDIVILTVSKDSPEVQADWCGAHGIERVRTLSDEQLGQFGRAFGLVMDVNGRLARAVYVIDAEGVIRYEQIVGEVSTEPDYDAALEAARRVSAGGAGRE